jgi:ABC-type multidrug transport system ATPase subunit
MDVAEWSSDDRGKHIGYLPQDIELFSGTIRENIARMNDGDPADVIAAAKKAGIHEMVLRMEKGYETEIGEGGAALSGGQRQRIALARALYGDPSFLVLDEPNANLDSTGESALMQAMESLRAEGMTIFVIAHRPNILKHVDKILVLKDGQVQEFGYRDDVMMKLQGTQKALPGPKTQTFQVRKTTEDADDVAEENMKPVSPVVTKAPPRQRPTAQAAPTDIKFAQNSRPTSAAHMTARPVQKHGMTFNGGSNGANGSNGIQVKKRPAVLTMGPSEKIKTKIQSLTSYPLSDTEISKIYALFVKGDQQGALKFIEDLQR